MNLFVHLAPDKTRKQYKRLYKLALSNPPWHDVTTKERISDTYFILTTIMSSKLFLILFSNIWNCLTLISTPFCFFIVIYRIFTADSTTKFLCQLLFKFQSALQSLEVHPQEFQTQRKSTWRQMLLYKNMKKIKAVKLVFSFLSEHKHRYWWINNKKKAKTVKFPFKHPIKSNFLLSGGEENFTKGKRNRYGASALYAEVYEWLRELLIDRQAQIW